MQNIKQNALPIFFLNLLLTAAGVVALWLYPSSSGGFYLLLLTGFLLPYSGHRALSPYLSARSTNTDPAGPIAFQKKRSEFALVAIAGLGAAGAAYGIANGAITPHRMSVSAATLGVVFLGLVSAVSILMLIIGPYKVVLSRDGIRCKLLGSDLIPWHAIRDVRVGHILTRDYVALNLFEPEVYMRRRAPRYQRAARADQKRGLSLFTLLPWMFGVEAAELKDALEEHIQRYGQESIRPDSSRTTIRKETE